MDDGNRLEEIQKIENELINPRLNRQVDFDLKALFTAKLCEKFKKDLKKNDFDSIEKTRITQKQIDYLIEMLETKNTKAKGYYYYRKQYEVKTIGELKQLIEKCDNQTENENGKLKVPIEEMYDVCSKIRKDVGHQGRLPMIHEARKYYANICRNVIEIFLDHSEEYQLK
ncbi:hypothetical protein BpHYR1_006524, partial [Brachionus plicatilis]